MIGDNPLVVVVIVLGIGAYLWMKLGRKPDRRRCPQCKRVALQLRDTGDRFDCPSCSTPLVRNADGTLRRA